MIKKKYALIPVMPTPNGPLHLGHLAGPFLKMDILARHLRILGHYVSIVSATDPYESHILPVCKKESKDELTVCKENYSNINKCLENLSIKYDNFINPLDDEYREKLFEITKKIIIQVLKDGNFSQKDEAIHFNSRTNDIVVASRIAGICPSCNANMGGYHCECCGQEVSPEELIEPYDTENKDDVLKISRTSTLFIDSDYEYISKRMIDCNVPDEIKNIVSVYIKKHGPLVRISNPGDWGIKLKDIVRTDSEDVVFTYTNLISLAILCGEEIKKNLNIEYNPLSKDSDCIVVGSFGFDNTIPFCLSVDTLANLSDEFRGFDYYLTNFFYTLDGKKFSTSRRHCIWGYDALEILETNSDIIRLYLSVTSPELKKTNFSTDEFNEFRNKIQDFMISINEDKLYKPLNIDSVCNCSFFKESLRVIKKSLSLENFSLQKSGTTIINWIENSEIDQDVKVLGFALLSTSIMPGISDKIISNIEGFDDSLLNEIYS